MVADMDSRALLRFHKWINFFFPTVFLYQVWPSLSTRMAAAYQCFEVRETCNSHCLHVFVIHGLGPFLFEIVLFFRAASDLALVSLLWPQKTFAPANGLSAATCDFEWTEVGGLPHLTLLNRFSKNFISTSVHCMPKDQCRNHVIFRHLRFV